LAHCPCSLGASFLGAARVLVCIENKCVGVRVWVRVGGDGHLYIYAHTFIHTHTPGAGSLGRSASSLLRLPAIARIACIASGALDLHAYTYTHMINHYHSYTLTHYNPEHTCLHTHTRSIHTTYLLLLDSDVVPLFLPPLRRGIKDAPDGFDDVLLVEA
jgi:hypothetical protein